MTTRSLTLRFLSAVLVCSLVVQTPIGLVASAQAEMISTDSFLSSETESSERARILNLLGQENVRTKLQEHGVSVEEATARVNSLSGAELAELNRKLDTLPAGQDAAGSILGVALAVFVILLITDILCVTKVFKFTRCAGA